VTEEKGWKEKTYDSGMACVGLRMKRVRREKEGEGMMLLINDLEAGPGPFESASLPPTGIVLRKEDEPKQHPPNTEFRRIIRRAADDRFESGTENDKYKIASKVIEDMQKKAYIFVNKDDNVWRNVNTKEVRNQVRKRLRKSVYFEKNRVTGKRKEGLVATMMLPSAVATSKFVPKDKNACIECNQPSNH
jgi:hypothetical protein